MKEMTDERLEELRAYRDDPRLWEEEGKAVAYSALVDAVNEIDRLLAVLAGLGQ